jgi:hypothetical protein
MSNRQSPRLALFVCIICTCLAGSSKAQRRESAANQEMNRAAAQDRRSGAGALCTPVSLPDPSYTDATNRCSLFIGSIEVAELRWTQFCYNSDSSFAAIFMPFAIQIRHVGTSWPSWSSPPFSEQPDPIVGLNPDAQLSILLQADASVAGFELETNSFSPIEVSASFKDRNQKELLNITRIVEGTAGGRLFAARCGEEALIDRIDITASDFGFAIAQLRSDAFTGQK